MISWANFGPISAKNALNLFAISSLSVIILPLSLKYCGNVFFFLVLLSISLMVFHVFLISSLNLVNNLS